MLLFITFALKSLVCAREQTRAQRQTQSPEDVFVPINLRQPAVQLEEMRQDISCNYNLCMFTPRELQSVDRNRELRITKTVETMFLSGMRQFLCSVKHIQMYSYIKEKVMMDDETFSADMSYFPHNMSA